MFWGVVAGGTTILSPFKGLELSVTWIVPPLEPTVCEATDVFEPDVTLTAV